MHTTTLGTQPRAGRRAVYCCPGDCRAECASAHGGVRPTPESGLLAIKAGEYCSGQVSWRTQRHFCPPGARHYAPHCHAGVSSHGSGAPDVPVCARYGARDTPLKYPWQPGIRTERHLIIIPTRLALAGQRGAAREARGCPVFEQCGLGVMRAGAGSGPGVPRPARRRAPSPSHARTARARRGA